VHVLRRTRDALTAAARAQGRAEQLTGRLGVRRAIIVGRGRCRRGAEVRRVGMMVMRVGEPVVRDGTGVDGG
jgi:hypothetical protein